MNSFLFFLSFILLNPWVLRFLSQTLIPGKVGGSDFFIFSPVYHFGSFKNSVGERKTETRKTQMSSRNGAHF